MKRLTLGTLLALVAGAILVAPGLAAKPLDAITCNPTGGSLSWTSGTTTITGNWFNANDRSVGVFTSNGPVGTAPAPLRSLRRPQPR